MINIESMDSVDPMGSEEREQYLEWLRLNVLDEESLNRFLLGEILDQHACGYNDRLSDEAYFDVGEDA